MTIFNHWLYSFNLLILKRILLFLLNNLDRNQTDLHRFKPSSRAILINEQLNHLYLLQHKDMTGLESTSLFLSKLASLTKPYVTVSCHTAPTKGFIKLVFITFMDHIVTMPMYKFNFTSSFTVRIQFMM